ncbi:hypothetical protein [Carboxylicivirga sp. RSCT41]|uniref:hypothetical protein n=1 Tax=Carboxylicivirga agarovorans TaxID=3417570 RepID=UPI003D33DD91
MKQLKCFIIAILFGGMMFSGCDKSNRANYQPIEDQANFEGDIGESQITEENVKKVLSEYGLKYKKASETDSAIFKVNSIDELHDLCSILKTADPNASYNSSILISQMI